MTLIKEKKVAKFANEQCYICNGSDFALNHVLWPELINDWQLSEREVAYIDRQQGESCVACGANLRSIALAKSIVTFFDESTCLQSLVELAQFAGTRILEMNEAGALTPYLKKSNYYTYAAYPDVDIHNLPYQEGEFDLVVHSDTLEHVQNPVHALSECRRVLRLGGALCFTVPVIVGRMSRSREGLKKSYHGNSENSRDDYMVHTEFGADAWTYLFEAGFSDIRIHSFGYPAGLALVGIK